MNKELIEKLKKLKGLYDDCDVWSIKKSEEFKERFADYQISHPLEEPEERIDEPENPLFGDYKVSPRELHGDMYRLWWLKKLAKSPYYAPDAADKILKQPFWFSEHEHSFKLASFDDIAKTTRLLDDSKKDRELFKYRLKKNWVCLILRFI